jgi:hypothetical protein
MPDISKDVEKGISEDAEKEVNKDAENTLLNDPNPPASEPLHSVFSKWERIAYVYIASLAAFSPSVASSIYYPAMLTLSQDLNTSLTNISLTITTFLVYNSPIFYIQKPIIISEY